MNANEHESEIVDDAPPLDFGLLKVQEKSEFNTRRFQIVYALGNVLVREPIGTFQFDYELIFNKKVGKIVAYMMPFVDHGKRCLTSRAQSPRKELEKQRPFVNLLKISSSQYIRDFISSANYDLRKVFVFICVHSWPLSWLPAPAGLLT